MKVDVLDIEGKKTGSIELPEQFEETYRPDVIKKAVQTIQANKRQAYGAKEKAGMRQVAKLSRRRRKYKGAYGKGISRIPRKTMSARGQNFYWVGAVAPGTVGGRRAHPPKASKIWDKKINKKEKQKAIRAALNASTILGIVKLRGHKVEKVPLIVEEKIETIETTKKARALLEKIGLKEELIRVKQKKVRAGKGKARARKYKIKKGPLIVVADKCNAEKSMKNIYGVDIVKVKYLNTSNLAPGTESGRLVVWSEKAIKKIRDEGLFQTK
ncbi:50S ribosomal protein L4 [Candidatus Woesearchaeota archaeon]|nr:50S ribosomal protein L4 [Candidatus Woesearchaeota archaeon]